MLIRWVKDRFPYWSFAAGFAQHFFFSCFWKCWSFQLHPPRPIFFLLSSLHGGLFPSWLCSSACPSATAVASKLSLVFCQSCFPSLCFSLPSVFRSQVLSRFLIQFPFSPPDVSGFSVTDVSTAWSSLYSCYSFLYEFISTPCSKLV